MSQSQMAHKNYGKVAVLMGGESAEREISLKSGGAVLQALLDAGVDAQGIDVQTILSDTLYLDGFDRAFIALHGRGGEDGQIQGILEALNIPYTGTGVQGSQLAMDKIRSKQVWLSQGLPTPEFHSLGEQNLPPKITGFPVVVKPASEGSTIGMTKVLRQRDLPFAIEKAREYDAAVLVEDWIEGPEYTVAILNGETLPSIRIEAASGFYDYHAKYESHETRFFCPSGLSEEDEREIADLSRQAFSALGCESWGRVDFMRDESGKFWLLEVNTVPGMTDHSLVPMAAEQAGINFQALVLRILDTSMAKESV